MKKFALILIGLFFLQYLSGQENVRIKFFDKESKIIGIYFSDYDRFTPSERDFLEADSIANFYVTNNSSKYVYDKTSIDNYRDYYKQVYGLINKKGDKIILLNCFCSVEFLPYWKEKNVELWGGGKCYFSIKINLNEKSIFDFLVNAPK